MRFSNRIALALLAGLMAVTGLWAQRPPGGMGGMFGSNPFAGMFSYGLQNSAPGSGAEYTMTSHGKDSDLTLVVLGKEDYNGAPGYWLEIRVISPDRNGEMVMKDLFVNSGADSGIKRMIVQAPGRPPMEMPMMGMNMMMQHQAPGGTPQGAGAPSAHGEVVGTESVTVPAGTFSCQHYRSQDQRGTSDVWIATLVAGWGVVKTTGPDASMVLKKVLSNETTHITGEPQKMNFPGMPPQ